MSNHSYFVEYWGVNGWQNAGWTDNNQPTVFKSREAAQDEINNVCLMTGESMLNYRISRVSN